MRIRLHENKEDRMEYHDQNRVDWENAGHNHIRKSESNHDRFVLGQLALAASTAHGRAWKAYKYSKKPEAATHAAHAAEHAYREARNFILKGRRI